MSKVGGAWSRVMKSLSKLAQSGASERWVGIAIRVAIRFAFLFLSRGFGRRCFTNRPGLAYRDSRA